jgi:thymidylate kinase
MKLLIIEGIATSGKSTIIELLCKKLSDKQVKVYGEPDTHVPIMELPAELHLAFFKSLLNEALNRQVELIIFDRFYLTQAFRAKVDLTAYKAIEEKLMPFDSLTVFLKVEPAKIKERVQKAIGHREAEWGQYVATKGDTTEQQASYYINQQESQLELLKQSILPNRIFETTLHNYDQISGEIIEILDLN